MITNLKDTETLEGSTLELVTKVSDCYPIPTCEWLKDDVTITANETHQIESDGSEYKLIVSNCSSTNEGTYRFKSTNDLGSVETSCQAFVLGKLLFKLLLFDKIVNFSFFFFKYSITNIH